MPSSSTSSSDPRGARRDRTRPRTRCAALAALFAFAATAALAFPAHDAAVAESYRVSWFHDLSGAARRAAHGRPLLALIGTSQTRRGLDPERVEQALGAGATGPFVFNLGMDGTHPCAYPYFVRRLLDSGPVDTIVLELGWIGHDQYQGIRFVRRYVEDAEVRDALSGNPVGANYMAPNREAVWLPLARLGPALRDAFDATRRHGSIVAGTAERARRRGFTPATHRKNPREMLDELLEQFERNPEAMEDRYVCDGLLASVQVTARICRERGVRLVCLVPPVNRDEAPFVPILKHFESAMTDRVLPALRARGIAVLVSPDAYFEADRFSDHVHLHQDAAGPFSDWLGAELRGLR